MPAWEDLNKRNVHQNVRDETFAEICAQALTTPAGRRLMDALRERYLHTVLLGNPSDGALREQNAKRQVVRELEEQTAAGLARRATEKSS